MPLTATQGHWSPSLHPSTSGVLRGGPCVGTGTGTGPDPVAAEAMQRVLQCSCCSRHVRLVSTAGEKKKPNTLTDVFFLCAAIY